MPVLCYQDGIGFVEGLAERFLVGLGIWQLELERYTVWAPASLEVVGEAGQQFVCLG